jgi:hypothetical protein
VVVRLRSRQIGNRRRGRSPDTGSGGLDMTPRQYVYSPRAYEARASAPGAAHSNFYL